jgi:hypothetical protein
LPRHHDVTDEAQEVALARTVGEITRHTHRLAHRLLDHPLFGAELLLVLLEHALMLAHVRNVPSAQVAEAPVFGLPLVILERLEESAMLHDRVVDLRLQEISTSFHECLR